MIHLPLKSYFQFHLKTSVSTDEQGTKTMWFDKPYFLYLEDRQSKAYLEMIGAEKFAKNLHEPAQRLIEKYTNDILKGFDGPLDFYDLGPGFPDKTVPLLKGLQEKRIDFRYIPVDISEYFLRITSNEIKKLGIKSKGINCYFEDLNKHINFNDKVDRFYFIGLTFNNYRPDKILSILKELSKNSGTCLIITEFYTHENLDSILVPYKDKHAEYFNYLSLKLVGFKKSVLKYFAHYKNQRIEMGFEVLENTDLGEVLIKKGTKIITAISYRYSRKTITNYITKYFHHYEYFGDKDKNINLVAFKLYPK